MSLEEGLAGERFYRWIGRITGRQISPGVFAGVNLAYEAAMVVAVRRALEREDAAWLVPAPGPSRRPTGSATWWAARSRAATRPARYPGWACGLPRLVRRGPQPATPAPPGLAARHHGRRADPRECRAIRVAAEPQIR